ncbi:hypothetical protein [Sulfitobacter sp.]|uniref:hypothetical protein n=1 Tax=Sulfitobacter sp. TaxID=1903071 RepID=UPI0030034185
MTMYSEFYTEMPVEEAGFSSRLESFFSGAPMPEKAPVDYDAGGDGSNDVRYHHSDEYDDHLIEKTYDQPAYVSPYDKAFTLVRSLEAQLESADPNQVHGIKAVLRDANAKWDTEKERVLDDRHRKIQLINRWRAENPDSYNATRRKARTEPNTSLSDMTPEEQAAHKKTLGADRKWRFTKAKEGWTPEQIETGMNKRVEKRQQKEEANV